MKKISMFLVSLFIISSYAFSQTVTDKQAVKTESAIKVEKLAVGTNVDKRELVGESTTFSKDVSKVYVWARVVEVSTAPTSIDFVFYVNDKKVDDIKLDVKGVPFRTWVIKTVTPGKWKVDIMDVEGNVASTSEFNVEETSEDSNTATSTKAVTEEKNTEKTTK